MTATEFMSGLGTIIIIAAVVIAAATSLLLLIVSIRPDFLNKWRSPGSSTRAKIKPSDPYYEYSVPREETPAPREEPHTPHQQ